MFLPLGVVEVSGAVEPPDVENGLLVELEEVAWSMGLSTLRLPSGAGHDAQVMAALCPFSMIFVPSHDGISHSPLEHTEPVHLSAGAEVLLHALLRIDALAP